MPATHKREIADRAKGKEGGGEEAMQERAAVPGMPSSSSRSPVIPAMI